MQYLEFRSRSAFYRTPLTEKWFQKTYRNIQDMKGNTWGMVKPMLLHSDCPSSIRDEYVKSPIWYVRLTAMLNKYSWRQYVMQAVKDPKSTVRQAAYKRLFQNIGISPIKPLDLLQIIEEDNRVHNYFNMDEVRMFLKNEATVHGRN